MSSNIKGCPFCGMGAAEAVSSFETSYRDLQERVSETFTVTCINCGAQGPVAYREADSILYWNRRS